MRFAAMVTLIAAAGAAPLAVVIAAPRLSEGEFIDAVRCTAYASADVLGAESTEAVRARLRLNAEARKHPEPVAQEARAEAAAIARAAAHADSAEHIAELRADRAAACAGAALAGAPEGEAST